MNTNKLDQQISEMEALINKASLVNNAVSSASIGWHLEHTLMVLERTLTALPASIVADYKPKSSFRKTIILFTKKIPRGVAKAPKGVRPIVENITNENLISRISSVKKLLATIPSISSHQFFSHPFFGDLRLKQAIRFLEIHTNHHLKIMREIGL